MCETVFSGRRHDKPKKRLLKFNAVIRVLLHAVTNVKAAFSRFQTFSSSI